MAAEQAAPLRLCADPDDLPFSSATVTTPGFYIELGNDIAKALGRPFQPVWVPTYYTKRQIRMKLLAGQCDGFLGVPDDASFMGSRLIFSQPVAQLGYALVAPAAMGISSVESLHGKRVAVQFSTPPQNLLAREPDVQMVTVLSPEEAMRDLADGKADAAFIWGASAGWLNLSAMQGAYRVVPVANGLTPWAASIAFRHDQPELRDAVNRALAGLGASTDALAGCQVWLSGIAWLANVVQQQRSNSAEQRRGDRRPGGYGERTARSYEARGDRRVAQSRGSGGWSQAVQHHLRPLPRTRCRPRRATAEPANVTRTLRR
jgi:ABC-type amino acid transport substrate-binding protein